MVKSSIIREMRISQFVYALEEYYRKWPPRNTVEAFTQAVAFKGVNDEIWYDIYIKDHWQGSVTPRNIKKYYPILIVGRIEAK